MNIITLTEDINIFGQPVTDFPNGIKEAFDALVDILPGGFEGRSYYGLSTCTDGNVLYIAAAHELEQGEAEKYQQPRHTIHAGDYLAVTLLQWHDKTDKVAGVFHEMSLDPRADHDYPCVEWYKSDEEMVCMFRMKS